MKKAIILSLMASLTVGAYAEGKLDLGSRSRLRTRTAPIEVTRSQDGTAKVRAKSAAQAESALRAFITVSDRSRAVEALEAAGATVTGGRSGIILCEFPESLLETIEAIPEVKAIQLERPVSVKLDRAREVSGIDKIHSGLDLPQAYTGKGVVCGIVDGGFDPRHINFLDENGVTRFGQFTYFRATQSGDYVQQVVDRDYIMNDENKFDTEDDENFHATHTTGIMAGGYRGPLNVAVDKNGFQAEIKELPNPYYGVAYDADIAAAAGSMSDYHIALGIEDILNYAYDAGKPSVINLSLGSNVGAHDGSSVICRYLDLASQQDRVVFCVSAGNEGDLPIAINKTFKSDDLSVKSCLFPTTNMTDYPNLRYGQVYIYSNDETNFQVQIQALNKNRNGNVAWRGALTAPEDGVTISKYWVSSSEYQIGDDDIIDPQFGKWFKGYVGIGSELDPDSGRTYAVLDYFCWDNTTGNAAGNYVIGFEVTGSDGQRIDIFCDGVYNNLTSYGFQGFSNGSTDGTISDVACGHNYVVVGSYNTRDDWASLDGGIYGYQNNFPSGKISAFTSYGTLIDGRQLPTVCAPGAAIISSTNEYYMDAYHATDAERQADITSGERRHSWFQSVGTSMSTPLVTGTIALWMEADPTLKYSDVLDIIRTTAVRDEDVTSHTIPTQWGAGKFDAYAGLKEVLRRASAGISEVSAEADHRLVVATAGDRRFAATLAGCDNFSVSLYDAAGRVCGTWRAQNGEATVDASALPCGIYFLKADGSAAKAARIAVK